MVGLVVLERIKEGDVVNKNNRKPGHIKSHKAISDFRPPMANPNPDDNVSPEDVKYLNGTPTRMEVANYVNSLLEEEYMPKLARAINANASSAKLGIMIMQAILIEKGICTGDEIEKLTTEFMERFTEEQKNKAKEADEKAQDGVEKKPEVTYEK